MKSAVDQRPIYRRLRDQIAADIASNRWAPGSAISSESELAKKHKISVATVRKAVDLLVNDGLIYRQQGNGMFVRRPDFSHAFIRFTRAFGSAGDTRIPDSHILKREVVPGPLVVTDALALSKNARVIRMVRLRLLKDVPVMREEIWLSAARFGPIMKMKDQQPRLLYPIYEDLCGEIVARVSEIITIGQADQLDTDLIRMPSGSPVVCIDRVALGYDDRPIEWRQSRSSATCFRYQVDIR